MSRSTPLAGVKVLSLEHAVAAPLCTRNMVDLGAEVIKIEPPTGDFARRYDSAVNGHSSHFVWLNRGKKSVSLDLKTPAGLKLMIDLASRADVMVSNLGPGVVERFVADERLTQLNNGLIRCLITGYGLDGPYRDRKAFDLLIQGEAGITRSTGTRDMPAKAGVSLADLSAGMYAFGAINSLLVERNRTGKGRRVEVSLFDCMIDWMSPLLAAVANGSTIPDPAGMHHATIAPYGPFETSDGALVNIAVQNDAQWRRLREQVLQDLNLPADLLMKSNEDRVSNRALVDGAVAARVRTLGRAELVKRLDAADIPWGDLNTVPDVVEHPQLIDRDRWVQVDLPTGDAARIVADPFIIDGDAGTGGRIPARGEHNDEVIAALGYGPEQIEQFRRDGAFGVPDASAQ